MPVRIAFAACSKYNFDPEQEVWKEIGRQRPKHLVLLGDQIYMDFRGDGRLSTAEFKGYENGDPRTIALPEFEAQMRLRYSQQFRVKSFRELVHDILDDGGKVAMVWDDHDFGFNNALGGTQGPQDVAYAEYLMPADKKAASRRLFEEFRWNVARLGKDKNADYAPLPAADSAALAPGAGVQSSLPLPELDVFLLDTRSGRQSPALRTQQPSSILGQTQWDQLEHSIRHSDKRLIVIASGSPFSSSGWLSDQSWKQGRERNHQPYAEYGRLQTLARQLHQEGKQLLFIGGDRHTAKIIDDDPALPEIVCAGAAAPKPPRRNGRHFCMLEAQGDNRATVQLYTRGKLDASLSLPVHAATHATAVAHPAQDAWAYFYTLFLVTNRRFDGDKPTDEATNELRYFSFDGVKHRYNEAVSLDNWDPVDAATFWEGVFQCSERLRQRNKDITPQICIFVPGNRETNESAIEQYRTLNDMAFNAMGTFCLGTCIAFDWATQWDAVPSIKNYENNVDRAADAAQLLRANLTTGWEMAQRAQVQLSLVAHSLGNRVAVQALAELPPGTVDRYYANAADLPQGFFESGATHQAVVAACKSILVPHTTRDFVLKKAAELSDRFPEDRVGHTGPVAGAQIPTNVHYKDIGDLVSLLANPHGCLVANPPDNVMTLFASAMVQGQF
ncbi:alkaline phosphatase D family protein [Pseudorhodoferax sp.]|uniref:alkaline phosphatase D family protein n=1 Tax=Pseudorhodoferax sp. TaxID=1993553 RepID=UPI002DD6428F|nr:alkaline phosphatase D family protein [Pseudorhodoferax sp.]